MANQAARHDTGTSTVRHDTARHGTMWHGGLTVPCLTVPPCRDLGPGTALWAVNRAVPCYRARQPGVPAPPPMLARQRGAASKPALALAGPRHLLCSLAGVVPRRRLSSPSPGPRRRHTRCRREGRIQEEGAGSGPWPPDPPAVA